MENNCNKRNSRNVRFLVTVFSLTTVYAYFLLTDNKWIYHMCDNAQQKTYTRRAASPLTSTSWLNDSTFSEQLIPVSCDVLFFPSAHENKILFCQIGSLVRSAVSVNII